MSNEMEKDDETYPSKSKKCPECLTHIPVEAVVCPSCKQRVGKRTDSGIAKKAINWKSYIMLIISWAAFIFYMWWAFFRE